MTPTFQTKPSIEAKHELLEKHSSLIAQLLLNRDIKTLEEAEEFLHPKWENNHDPLLMLNVKEGIKRLRKAVESNEQITIYADYDADGIPGAVVLSSLLDAINYENYKVYLPHRHDEGYGIHIEALEKIKKTGTSLIVTIDVGITAHEAAQWSIDNEIDMIITDHHEPLLNEDGSQNLPKPLLLINPKQESCSYPDDMLCGCGVIFKFVQAFVGEYAEEYKIHDGWEKWLLDMVGLSTISDMVPLRKENRIFAKFGMKVIPKTKRLGLKKLIWDAGLNMQHLTEEDLAFSVTPKLNAASRMSHPEDALAALIAKSDVEATTAVKHLDKLNKERKKLVASTMKTVHGKLKDKNLESVIIVGSPDWQAGILGLVASKIVEKYKLPAFVWSEEQGVIKGSCRSVNDIDLVKLMSETEEGSLIQFGGHTAAGGFSCDKNEIHFLQERLEKAHKIYQEKNPKTEEKLLEVDCKLSLDEVTVANYKELRTLAPFGQGNPKPSFIFSSITPTRIETFGKEKNHLKLWFKRSDGTELSAIEFFATPEKYKGILSEEKTIDLIAEINYSVFMGKHELRLGIINIHKNI